MTDMHISLDLETLSSDNDAAVVAIGAVAFWPEARLSWHRIREAAESGQRGGFRLDEAVRSSYFYHVVKFKSAIDAGGAVDGDTLEWWFGQPDEARRTLFEGGVAIETAYRDLRRWIESEVGRPEAVWAHATFDLPVLDTSHKMVGMKLPWGYRAGSDLRTLIRVVFGTYDYRHFDGSWVPGKTAGELAHNALVDAGRQAMQVQFCYETLDERGLRPQDL